MPSVEGKEMGVLVLRSIRAVELRQMSVDVFLRIDAGVALISDVIQANLISLACWSFISARTGLSLCPVLAEMKD